MTPSEKMALPIELRALETACQHFCSAYGDAGLRRARSALRRERKRSRELRLRLDASERASKEWREAFMTAEARFHSLLTAVRRDACAGRTDRPLNSAPDP